MWQFLLDQAFELAALIFLLGCSAFFSGSETALFSLTREERHRMALQPSRSARYILSLLDDPQALLSTILFGNMVVNVAFYSISTLVLVRVAEISHAAAAASGFASLLIVITLGEVSPKGIAVGHPVGFAQMVAPLLYAFHAAALPIGRALKWLAEKFSGFFVSRLPRLPYVTREELKMLTGMAERHGVLDRRTRGMIEQAVEIAHIRVNEVMTPRVDVAMFDLAQGRDAFCQLVRRTHEDRIPVYRESQDNVAGILLSRDVFLHPDRKIEQLARPARFVPETQTVDSLLRQFRRTREPVAIVVDEYGGTSGMVTLEHLLEEVVGDIRSESEPVETAVRALDEDTYLLAGDLNTHEWRQLLGISFDPPGIETMAGFVISLLGKIPKEGDSVQWRGLWFVVEKMSGRRVVQVRVERMRVGEEDRGE